MKLKYRAIRGCKECNGTGYWYSAAADTEFRCECYKKTKKYKNRKWNPCPECGSNNISLSKKTGHSIGHLSLCILK